MAMFVRKKLVNLLSSIAGFLDKLHYSLDRYVITLRMAAYTDAAQSLEKEALDVSVFEKDPREYSESLLQTDLELKDAVFLYFLTKKAMALYEAQMNYLPLQIYNEMRNALDHYMRAIVVLESKGQGSSRRQDHVKKMTAHLQRALLDIIKITCASMVDKISSTHQQIGEKSLSLTQNGEYIKKITELQMSAEKDLVLAKSQEHSLGDGAEESVRLAYLSALTSHVTAYKYFQDNLSGLRWGRAKYLSLKGTTFTLTVLGSTTAGYLVRVFWSGTENWTGIKFVVDFLRTLGS